MSNFRYSLEKLDSLFALAYSKFWDIKHSTPVPFGKDMTIKVIQSSLRDNIQFVVCKKRQDRTDMVFVLYLNLFLESTAEPVISYDSDSDSEIRICTFRSNPSGNCFFTDDVTGRSPVFDATTFTEENYFQYSTLYDFPVTYDEFMFINGKNSIPTGSSAILWLPQRLVGEYYEIFLSRSEVENVFDLIKVYIENQ